MTVPSTMKAVAIHEADDMRVETRPVPKPGLGEVLLKVEVASICGTDVKVLHRTLAGMPAADFIMGHEYAGTVAALGPGVDEFAIGDRVAVEVHKGCDRCENCIKGWYTSCLNYGDIAKGHRAKGLTCDGGFAEYAANHINTLYRLPENLSFEQACMVTTAASPLWAIDLMGGYVAGETVLVQGPGPSGSSPCSSVRRSARRGSSSPAPATRGWRSVSSWAPTTRSTSATRTSAIACARLRAAGAPIVSSSAPAGPARCKRRSRTSSGGAASAWSPGMRARSRST